MGGLWGYGSAGAGVTGTTDAPPSPGGEHEWGARVHPGGAAPVLGEGRQPPQPVQVPVWRLLIKSAG